MTPKLNAYKFEDESGKFLIEIVWLLIIILLLHYISRSQLISII